MSTMGISAIPWDLFERLIIPHLHVQDIHSLRVTCKEVKAYTDQFANQRAARFDAYFNVILPDRRQNVWFLSHENDPVSSFKASIYGLWTCIDIKIPFLGSSFDPFTEFTLGYDVCGHAIHVYKPGDLHELMSSGTARELNEHMSPTVRHCLTRFTHEKIMSARVEWTSFDALILVCCSNGWSYERMNNYIVQAAIALLEEDMQSTRWHLRGHNAYVPKGTRDMFLVCTISCGESYDPYATDLQGAHMCNLSLGISIRSTIYDVYMEIDSLGRLHIMDPVTVRKMYDATEKTILHNIPDELAASLYGYYIDSLRRTDRCHIQTYADYDKAAAKPGEGLAYLLDPDTLSDSEYKVLKERCV